MPAQYEKIRDTYLAKGKSDKDAKTIAAKIFIAKGRGKSRSARAKLLVKDKNDGSTKARISNTL